MVLIYESGIGKNETSSNALKTDWAVKTYKPDEFVWILWCLCLLIDIGLNSTSSNLLLEGTLFANEQLVWYFGDLDK